MVTYLAVYEVSRIRFPVGPLCRDSSMGEYTTEARGIRVRFAVLAPKSLAGDVPTAGRLSQEQLHIVKSVRLRPSVPTLRSSTEELPAVNRATGVRLASGRCNPCRLMV